MDEKDKKRSAVKAGLGNPEDLQTLDALLNIKRPKTAPSKLEGNETALEREHREADAEVSKIMEDIEKAENAVIALKHEQREADAEVSKITEDIENAFITLEDEQSEADAWDSPPQIKRSLPRPKK